MVRSKTRRLALAIAAMTAMLQQASAATSTGTLAVSATVVSSCAVSSGSIDFGTYLAGAATARDVPGTIGYSKCFSMPLKVELDLGLNATGTNRQMKSGASTLRYQIFQDSARTKTFSTGTNALLVNSDATGAASIPIYGRIFSAQAVPAGAYTDTIGILLTF